MVTTPVFSRVGSRRVFYATISTDVVHSRTLMLAIIFFVSSVALAVPMTATNSMEISAINGGAITSHKHFDLTGILLRAPTKDIETLILKDEFGLASIYVDFRYQTSITPGDRVRVAGNILRKNNDADRPIFDCTNIEVVAHGPPPHMPTLKGDELLDSAYDGYPVKVTGVVLDAFQDEIDPNFIKLELMCDGRAIYATSRASEAPYRIKRGLIGSRVEICGVFSTSGKGLHPYSGRSLVFGPDDIRIVSQSEDHFKVPELDERQLLTHPSEAPILGRRRMCGRVLAKWRKDTIIMRTKTGHVERVVMAEPVLPHVGECIECVGFVETDIYFLNLTRAHWRTTKSWEDEAVLPTNVTARAVMFDAAGNLRYDPRLHGLPVRIRGTVIKCSQGDFGRMIIESDEVLVPVEVGSAGNIVDVLPGDTVEITGICVLDTENWRPNAPIPRIRGFFIVLTGESDVVIISSAPWWTLKRLFAVICLLVAGIVGVLVWNRSLARRSDMRGQELARERVAHIASEIKTMERTRLAVELHDSVAQNLAGIALNLQAAQELAERDPKATSNHLNIANASLRSCRSEIRSCLMDLRSNALDMDDMNDAIRHTLDAFCDSARVRIRFNVPRACITDNTAHALLRIIRELASNAIRHGHASKVMIAGVIEDGQLMFSVKDNGCGFDPRTSPGIREGHYGLQGIRERIASFSGRLSIDGVAGGGTNVSITMKLPIGT